MENSFSSELGCMSSAGSCSQEMCFYSVPTSPARSQVGTDSGFQTAPTSPKTYEDANSNLDEFEFETSRSFDHSNFVLEARREDEELRIQRRECRDSLPAMAFADELFCNGKVLPLVPPLKLPPRLENGNCHGRGSQSSINLSPRSPSSMLRVAFSHQSLWNDDFDPFTVALENVKEEKRGKSNGKNGYRRIRSPSPARDNETRGPNSPLGLNNKQLLQGGVSAPKKEPVQGLDGQAHLTSKDEKEGAIKQPSRSPKFLSEPKGLVFARHVRLVRLENDRPIEENNKEKGKEEIERSGSWRGKRKGVKKRKIMKFLFGFAYMEKATNEDKLEDKKAAVLGKPKFFRKLSFRVSNQSNPYKDEIKCEETISMPMVSYKPRLFFCLRNRARYVK